MVSFLVIKPYFCSYDITTILQCKQDFTSTRVCVIQSTLPRMSTPPKYPTTPGTHAHDFRLGEGWHSQNLTLLLSGA